ncbi:hypothetical protein FB451DRAFT_1047209 [Mycena latifolia]|nr:hypothetical protein FB451DRAFT_1047209 [Mycena latifolia]
MVLNTPHVDRRGASRTVPMKVLALGFCRTGTASMRSALETLGYKDTHHMQTVLANPIEVEMWTEAVDAKFFGKGKPYGREEWDQLLGNCQAVTDAPAILFSEELVAAYPDAQVVLTNRDPERWWKSYNESLGAVFRSKRVMLACWLEPAHFGKVLTFADQTMVALLGSHVKHAKEDESKARFIAHYESIRRMVPKEMLLEYEVGEGWDRLCAFLGNDIPDTNFPRVNDTLAVKQRIDAWAGQIFRRTATRLAVPTALLASVCLALYAQKYNFW